MTKKRSESELMLKSIMLNNPEIDNLILQAFKVCDRKFFVKERIYTDEPVHIAHGQTISQPSTIARMLRMLRLEKGMDLLEVGANTGYHAALAAYISWPGSVTTIEIFSDLADMAKENVNKLIKWLGKEKKSDSKKFEKIKIIAGDALDKKGEVWKQKYDRIYFTAGVDPDKLPIVKEMGKALLKDRGLLLYPTRESWDWGAIEVWQKNKELKLISREKGYSFVPLLRKEDIADLYEKYKK
jgi:protein-L-isoaspartate(D-aspartate) O-methyltransferase